MPLHVPQSIAALERGVHVLSEVPAGVSISACRRLLRACSGSRASYMLSENVTYTRPNMIVTEMVRRGEFSTRSGGGGPAVRHGAVPNAAQRSR